MKSIMNRIVVVMIVAALASVAAFAKVHKTSVKFATDMKVNNTLVKKGTYDVKFDDETGKLSIVKNGKVVAEANAKFETREKKASDVQLRSAGSEDGAQLLGVTFGGSDKEIVISNGAGANTGNN